MSNIDFIRHGDHKAVDGESLYCGLNECGCNEARLLQNRLNLTGNKIIAYSVDNLRSIGAITLALNPEIDNAEVEGVAKTLVANGIICTDNRLDYARQERSDYREDLDIAFFTSKALRFFVNRSDRFQTDGFSTYSTMASEVARRIVNSRDGDDTIVLAREFFYPSFRAKLIEAKDGVGKRDYYADWYGEHVEWNPDARKQVNKVIGCPNRRGFILRDEYGEIEFSSRDLSKIMKGMNNE